MKTETTVLFLTFFLLICIVAAAVIFNTNIKNAGEIKVTGIECDTQVLDWGNLEPGQSANRTVNIHSTGTGAVSLAFNVSDWQPLEAEQWLSLTWDYDGSSVGQEWFSIVFVLAVASEIVGVQMFNFTINIYGM